MVLFMIIQPRIAQVVKWSRRWRLRQNAGGGMGQRVYATKAPLGERQRASR